MAAHRGLYGAPWRGAWLEFHRRQRGEEQTQAGSDDGTPQCTIADATAQGSRCTRGHPCDRGVVTGGRPVTGNLAGVGTRASRAG
jgi:hypothetical protein